MEWRGRSIMVPCPDGAVAGAAVQLSIKYEDLEIARAGANGVPLEGRNQLPGKLRDIIFKGQTANYIVAIADGVEIVASATPRAVSLRPNEAVVVHWPAAGGACFPV
jgi:ABC-type Fe3+/spermidine/putrescine transport system ATPase subunit